MTRPRFVPAPAAFGADLDRLRHFLEVLRPRHRCGFELRNATWHWPEVDRELEPLNRANCGFDLSGFESAIRITAVFAYVRMHGPEGKYGGSYSDEALSEWAGRMGVRERP